MTTIAEDLAVYIRYKGNATFNLGSRFRDRASAERFARTMQNQGNEVQIRDLKTPVTNQNQPQVNPGPIPQPVTRNPVQPPIQQPVIPPGTPRDTTTTTGYEDLGVYFRTRDGTTLNLGSRFRDRVSAERFARSLRNQGYEVEIRDLKTVVIDQNPPPMYTPPIQPPVKPTPVYTPPIVTPRPPQLPCPTPPPPVNDCNPLIGRWQVEVVGGCGCNGASIQRYLLNILGVDRTQVYYRIDSGPMQVGSRDNTTGRIVIVAQGTAVECEPRYTTTGWTLVPSRVSAALGSTGARSMGWSARRA